MNPTQIYRFPKTNPKVTKIIKIRKESGLKVDVYSGKGIQALFQANYAGMHTIDRLERVIEVFKPIK